MMIGVTISAGVYSTLTGELMKLDVNMFCYSLFAYSIILFGVLVVILKTFWEEAYKADENKNIQLP